MSATATAKKTRTTQTTKKAKKVDPDYRSLAPMEALVVQKALSKDGVSAAVRNAVGPTPSTSVDKKTGKPKHDFVDVEFTARFSASVRVSADGDRRATSNFLRKSLLAMILKRSGVQADWIEKNLPGIVMEILQMKKTEEEALFKSMPAFRDAMARVDAMIDELPRIPAKGQVSVKDVEISVVEYEQLDELPEVETRELPESAQLTIGLKE